MAYESHSLSMQCEN